jgi:hypothetical protein
MKELTRNELFSNDKKNFHINKEAWDKYSKLENSKVIQKHITEPHQTLCVVSDGIIGTSYKVQKSVVFKGLKK